jgi:hypothetical protein
MAAKAPAEGRPGRALTRLANNHFSEAVGSTTITARYDPESGSFGDFSATDEKRTHIFWLSKSGVKDWDAAEAAVRAGFVAVVISLYRSSGKSGFLKGDGITRDIREADVWDLAGADAAAKAFLGRSPENAQRFNAWADMACQRTQDRLDANWPAPRRRLTAKERALVYAKCGGRCAYCGRPIAIADIRRQDGYICLTACIKDGRMPNKDELLSIRQLPNFDEKIMKELILGKRAKKKAGGRE